MNGRLTAVLAASLLCSCEQQAPPPPIVAPLHTPIGGSERESKGKTTLAVPSFAKRPSALSENPSLRRQEYTVAPDFTRSSKNKALIIALDAAFNEYIDIFPTLMVGTKLTAWSNESGYVAFAIAPKKGRRLTAFRYVDASKKPEWYDVNGQSLASGFLARPLAAHTLTSKYGVRFHPIDNQVKVHRGTDYGAPEGAPVWAAAAGKVIAAGTAAYPGNFVVIAHPEHRTKTKYFHLSRILVSKGQHVSKGQKIGLVGTTGHSTGPHLHYEVVRAGTHVDPLAMRPRTSRALGATAKADARVIIAELKRNSAEN